MSPALLLLAAALADVPALRAEGLALDVGQVAISAATPLGSWLHLGAALQTQGLSPEVQVGLGLPLVERRWTCEALFAGGLLLPWRAPALTHTATAGLRGSREGQRLGWEGSLLVPLALEMVPDRVLRVPVRAEQVFGVRAGPVWIGARSSLGASLVTGGARTLNPELGLRIDWRPASAQP